jgi:hypothetical protein
LASVGVVVAINVIGGFIQIVDSPARQALVSRLVPSDDLASAVSLNGVVVNTARVVGPALAGVLIVTVGTTPCFAVNALSYVAVVAALIAIRPLTGVRRPGGRGLQLHSSIDYRGRIMALWMFVYIGTSPVGTVLTGWITAVGGTRSALLVGAGACIVAAGLAARVRPPSNPDLALTDLAT